LDCKYRRHNLYWKTAYGRTDVNNNSYYYYYYYYYLKTNEIGGACVTYGRQERCIQDFGGDQLTERDH
jgi:hypothetical protein